MPLGGTLKSESIPRLAYIRTNLMYCPCTSSDVEYNKETYCHKVHMFDTIMHIHRESNRINDENSKILGKGKQIIISQHFFSSGGAMEMQLRKQFLRNIEG